MKSVNNLNDNSKTYYEDDENYLKAHLNTKNLKKENYFMALQQLKTKVRNMKNNKIQEVKSSAQKVKYSSILSTSNKSILEFSEQSREAHLFQRKLIGDKYSYEAFNNNTYFHHSLKKTNNLIQHTKDKRTEASTCKSNELNDLDEEIEIPVVANFNCNNSGSNSQSEDEKFPEKRRRPSKINENDEILVVDDDINQVQSDFRKFNLCFSDVNIFKKGSSSKRRNQLAQVFQNHYQSSGIKIEKLSCGESSIKKTSPLREEDNLLDLIEDNSIFIEDEENKQTNNNKIEIKKHSKSEEPVLNMSFVSPCENKKNSTNYNCNNQHAMIKNQSFRSITKNLNFMNQSVNKSQISSRLYANNQVNTNKTSFIISNSSNNSFLSIAYTPDIKREKNDSNFIKNDHSQSELDLIIEEDLVPVPIYDVDFIQNLIESDRNYKPSYENSSWLLKDKFSTFSERRAFVIDWIMEISEEYGFKRDTFHSAVNIFDRFVISKEGKENIDNFALIACSCMLISSKIEEIQVPRAEEYVNSSNNLFTLENLIDKEKDILFVSKLKLINKLES